MPVLGEHRGLAPRSGRVDADGLAWPVPWLLFINVYAVCLALGIAPDLPLLKFLTTARKQLSSRQTSESWLDGTS